MERVDVAIVGGGMAGLAAAWRLALSGVDVVLFDRAEIGNRGGSSHGATRIFRFAYDDPVYVRLAQTALPLWRELESSSGRQLLSITGGLDVGDPAYLDACEAALRSCGARAERLRPEALRDRFPWIQAGHEEAVFSPDTGVVGADRALHAFADTARASGARIFEGTVCETVVPSGDSVEVRTRAGVWRARSCVIAAGGWAAGLLERTGVEMPVRVTREQVFYFRAPPDAVPFIHRREIVRYGVPGMWRAAGFKVAEHGTGATTSADARTFEIDEVGAARVREYVREVLPGFDPEPLTAETCLYTMTPDEGFVLDARGPIVIASACSGHGFKFAPAVGDIVARIATDSPPLSPLEPFMLDRFGRAR